VLIKKRSLVLPEKQLILDLDKGFRPTSSRSYSRDVKKLYDHCCVISCLKESENIFIGSEVKTIELAVHHLYSQKHYPSFKMSLLNGLPLTKDMHYLVHKNCGKKTDPHSFIQYLKILQRDSANYDLLNLQLLIDWVGFLDRSLIETFKEPLK
jgi:hypothetical protein